MKTVITDGGRAAAGFRGTRAHDCVARAVAIATQRPYAEIHRELAAVNTAMPRTRRRMDTGRDTADHGVYTTSVLFKRYMVALGFVWTPTMHIGSGCTVHLRADELPAGRLVVAVSRHYAAVIDGVLHDTNDCSRRGTRCVYGYWRLA